MWVFLLASFFVGFENNDLLTNNKQRVVNYECLLMFGRYICCGEWVVPCYTWVVYLEVYRDASLGNVHTLMINKLFSELLLIS